MADPYAELERLIAEGDLSTAESRLLDWLQYHPSDARAWLLYGKCVTNTAQKRDCFERALDLDPSIVEARQLLEQLNPAPAVQAAQEKPGEKPSVESIQAPPAAFRPGSVSPKAPLLSERSRARLSLLFYSVLYFLFTGLLGLLLVLAFSAAVPGLLTMQRADTSIQRNWLAGSSDASPELQNLASIFLNPSRLDYRRANTYEELKRLQTSITLDPSSPDATVEFRGVSFTGQLVGGSVLQAGNDGRPIVVLMEVLFGDTPIPVLYYGPVDRFHDEDMVLVEGVYIEEGNGVVAQRVERLSGGSPTPAQADMLLLLRAAGLVLLWALLCFSIFFWRLSLKRWGALAFPQLAILLLILPWVLFTTGCTIDLSTTLQPDGTGTTSILVSESRENMDFLRSAPGVSGYLSGIVREIKRSGAMFEQYMEGDQEVFIIQRYFNNTSSETGNTYPISGSWTHVQRYREGNEEVIRFLGIVDTRTLYNTPPEMDPNVAGLLQEQLSQINMRYRLNLPGSLVYSNGEQAGGQQVTWQIRMNEANYLIAETRFPAEGTTELTSYTLYLWIGLAAILFVSTLLLIMSIRVRPSRSASGRQS